MGSTPGTTPLVPHDRSDRTHHAAYRRVGVFGVLLLVSGAALFGLVAVPQSPPDPIFTIPWFVLAIVFYVTEVKVLHVHFRRETQAFSLNEIPLVVGLFFTPGLELIVAAVTGGVAALVFSRRQRGVKLAVNVGHILLASTLAVVIFHAITLPGVSPGPRSWLAAVVAALAASLVNVFAIFSAITLSEGRAEISKLPQIVSAGLVQTITTVSLALVAVTLMWLVPSASVLLVVPAVTLYLAFKGYTIERERHQSLEFLYQSSRILQETPEVGAAVRALLRQARETFRSEIAEATLFPAEAGAPILRASADEVRDGGEMRPVPDTTAEEAFITAVSLGKSAIVQPGAPVHEALQRYLAYRGFRDAMIVPLRGETRIMGAILLANRLGQVSPYREDELRLFETLANNASVSLENTRLERTLVELRELKEELRHQANHDALTGLANRALFAARVEAAIAASDAPGSVAVLYLDLDDFKSVNDSLGHEAGDALLIGVTERIQGSLRPGDLAARLGGDEFAILLEGVSDAEQVMAVADRILQSLRFPIRVDDRDIIVRSSIGIARNRENESGSNMIRHADIAMYRAKHASKGRYLLYESGMAEAVNSRLALRTELLRGVDESQFVVHYQPLYDLRLRTIVGLEALVRWRHPDRGTLEPDEFIQQAEDTGLVLPIGDMVVRTACAQLARWQSEHAPGLVMTVNISAKQLRHDTIVRTVSESIEDSGIRPGTLILEITERDLMDDTEANLERLAALKALGVQLAIDDFGTGYSSLAYLRRFPVDIVKIAKPFVDGVTQAGDGGVLARAIIELSRALGLRTIAEGIEVREQRERLSDWGCEIGQGWLFARAADPELVSARLADETRLPGLRRLIAVPSTVDGTA